VQTVIVQYGYRVRKILVSLINRHLVSIGNIVPVVLRIDKGCVYISYWYKNFIDVYIWYSKLSKMVMGYLVFGFVHILEV